MKVVEQGEVMEEVDSAVVGCEVSGWAVEESAEWGLAVASATGPQAGVEAPEVAALEDVQVAAKAEQATEALGVVVQAALEKAPAETVVVAMAMVCEVE